MPKREIMGQSRCIAQNSRRLFLSCVSHEFRSYRDVLAANLSQPGVELRRQEDFVNTGRTTLEKLNDYIRTCDAVIHLVGSCTGTFPEPAEVSALLPKLPGFGELFGLKDQRQDPGLSYTQWEAWLALYYEKPLALYKAASNAERELGFIRDEDQARRQDIHWSRLEARGRDRKEFLTPQDLSIEVLRGLPLMIPAFSENIRQGEARDRNLLFAVLALQDDILTHDSFVRVCRSWAEDTGRDIAEIMRAGSLLTPEDQALVEARLERKLKKRQGDIRTSLADSLGSDARNSLGSSLDPTTLASLPDSFKNLADARSSGQWRYRLTRTHGVGGLGVVSVAEDTDLERVVALKQLRPERTLDPMALARFVREARITGRLQHPNIVPVYEFSLRPDDQVPFYAMRFLGHRTLHDAIAEFFADKGASDADRNLRFRTLLQSFLAVCNAVAFAHGQGVIHRDIKPANIMIGDFGEVILLDWGLAKSLEEFGHSRLAAAVPSADASASPENSQVGVALGSPAYMAPEQVSGRIDLHDARTDVYGLGATLHEILTGDVPFTGATTEELFAAIQTHPLPNPCHRNPLAPAPLAAVCLKALNKDPDQRYPTVQTLAGDIQQWLADEPVSVYPDSLSVQISRVIGRHPFTTTATIAGLLGMILALAVSFSIQFAREQEASFKRQQVEQSETIRPIHLHELTRLVFAAGSAVEQALHEKQRAYRQAIEIQQLLVTQRPDLSQLRFDLAHYHEQSARLAMKTGDFRMALDSYSKAVDLRLRVLPELNGTTSVHNRLAVDYAEMAWINATSPDAAIRNGTQAVVYATRANTLKNGSDASYLDTLAASYAEAGNFEQAVKTAEQAVAAAPEDRKKHYAQRAQQYRAKNPYHEDAADFPSKVHD